MTADSMGRPPKPAVEPEFVRQLLAKAHELQVRQKPPEPILMGRHLIEHGLEPEKLFGEILHKAYEAQLEGTFGDLPQALKWLAGEDGVALPGEARRKLEERMRND
jgi:tRNA nucleotidyltransferase (CCA-adding enzyme)